MGAEEMREELRRRNNTRTHGTQTTVTGPKLDEQTAEIKRLKVMLEEMQMKLKDTVFQRLYDDALHRVDRLEKLRDKVRREKHQYATPSTNGSAVVEDTVDAAAAAVAAAAAAEGSVLAAVEQSPLRG